MAQLKPTKTVYSVSQFLDWQRSGTLVLKPLFQRREVWKPKAKSMLIDTVARGLPMPIVFLRKRQDLKTFASIMEVVDGQQRLRTLLAFIDPGSLKDYKAERDDFEVLLAHNRDLADRPFSKLPASVRAEILEYELSTHVFPPSTGDDVVLRIFARMNSTGLQLNKQELRNSEFYGEFKTLAYDLAFQQLDRWRKWKVFSDNDMARMVEVESVSDYLIAMMQGLQGKSQQKLDKFYRDYDDKFPGAQVLRARFVRTMSAIDDAVGNVLAGTTFRRQALFYSLFAACYEHLYGLGSDYRKKRTPKPLPARLAARLQSVSERIAGKELPESIQDAMDKATADPARRRTRHTYLMGQLRLESAD